MRASSGLTGPSPSAPLSPGAAAWRRKRLSPSASAASEPACPATACERRAITGATSPSAGMRINMHCAA